jgi:Protein kinase domain
MPYTSRSKTTATTIVASLPSSSFTEQVYVDDEYVARKSLSKTNQDQNEHSPCTDKNFKNNSRNNKFPANNDVSSLVANNNINFEDSSNGMTFVSSSMMLNITSDASQQDILRSRNSSHGVATTPITPQVSTEMYTSPKQRNGTSENQILRSPLVVQNHHNQNGRGITESCKKSSHRAGKRNGNQNSNNLSSSLPLSSNSQHSSSTTKKTSPRSTKSIKRNSNDNNSTGGIMGMFDGIISLTLSRTNVSKVWKNSGGRVHTIALLFFLVIVIYSVGCFITIHRTIVNPLLFPSSDKNIVNVPFPNNFRKNKPSQHVISQNITDTEQKMIDPIETNDDKENVHTSKTPPENELHGGSQPLDATSKQDDTMEQTKITNEKKDTVATSKQLPRVIYLDSTWSEDEWHHRRDKMNIVTLNNNYTTGNEFREHYYAAGMNEEKCIAKSEWQIHSKPNCNTIHEIDFAIAAANAIIDHDPSTSTTSSSHHKHHLQYYISNDKLKALGEGWFRTTWRLDRTFNRNQSEDNHHHHHNDKHHHDEVVDLNTEFVDSVVLKTLRIERDFLSEFYELHRRDAVAMERLTGSDYVVNVFAFCAQSAINELANFNYPGIQNLESFNRRLRGINNQQSSAIKIRMAASIALGLADIHAAGEENTDDVFMVHYDLNPRNIALFAGGKPKINDFNIAEFIRRDPITNESCGFPSRLHEPWWRAPEEMNLNATDENVIIDEKVDIYALGNILYHTLTSHSPWGKMRHERIPEVIPYVAKGIHPDIPKLYLNDKDRNVKAMIKAIKMCWVKDPTKRATAHDVAAVLIEPLLRNNNKGSNNVADKGLPMWNDIPYSKGNNEKPMDNDDTDEEDAIENKAAIAT